MGDTTEPTVQVPVSLIERFVSLAERADEAWANGVAGDFRALLSQPTPSAEQCTCQPPATHLGEGPDQDCPKHGERLRAEPPRIADMAPGTALTADITFAHRFLRTTNGLLDIDDGMTVGMTDIDPSTIRDVTPPTPTT